jgi:hypothetical protein
MGTLTAPVDFGFVGVQYRDTPGLFQSERAEVLRLHGYDIQGSPSPPLPPSF